MPGLALDTNALSAIAEGNRTAIGKFSRASQVSIPVIVLGEYRFGIQQSRHRPEYEDWISDLISISRVLHVDDDTAVWYARIRLQLKRAGTPIPSNDAWIAALCVQHALPIMSRDAHFDLVEGLRRTDW